MTVCIAAVCPSLDKIILVSDALRSDGSTSVEGMTKFHQIGHRWIAMVAAEDISRFPPLMRRVESIVGARTSFEALTESCQKAYAAELERYINQEILLSIGKTREEIVEHGLEWFGEYRHADLMSEIRAATLATDLLVAGFDEDGSGHILAMHGGIVSDVSELRYFTIGAGSNNANGVLNPIADFVFGGDLSELVYRVLSAKFAAESTPSVGKDTVAMVLSPTEEWRFMVNSDINKIRDIWRSEGRPPYPVAAKDILSNDRTFLRVSPAWVP